MADPEPAGGKRSLTRRDALRITAVAGVGAALGGTLGLDLVRELRMRRVAETRTRMGTLVGLTVVHPDAAEARAWIEAGFAEMERLEAILSRHRPDTPLSRLNASGRVDGAPRELAEVLIAARDVAELTDGAFDHTVAPVLELYRTGAAQGRLPSDDDVRSALELVDHRGVRLDGDVVRLADTRMSVTLDGIAKGFIVDRTVDVLVRRGAGRILVDAGGDMATSGADPSPWTVGIQDPHASEVMGRVHLVGESIATSADYMNVFSDDRRAHHIIDPRTGRSPLESSSVSVIAPTAMRADALSTAVLVLGPTAGRALLERLPGVEGIVVSKDGERFVTSGLARRLG